MQDIHSIGGARIFGGGDRRLRPLHHQNHQALKCPRCDSLNTKFCYYNNYNLSQPRHFCKNCRRYWTKGGVLRNVPVGGGCRKTKRNSKPKPCSDSSQQQQEKERKTTINNNNNVNNNNNNNNNSNSSASDSSSSLTVTNNTNVETVSVHSSSGSVSNVFGFTAGCTGDDNNGGFNQLEQGQDCGNIFPEIGSFTSLIASSSNEPLHFGFNNFLNINPSLHDDNHVHQQWHQHVNHDHRPAKLVNCSSVEGQDNLKSVQGTTDALMIDQTAQIGFSGLHDDSSIGRNSNGDFGPLDWQETTGDDRGLFDLPSAVDHSSYWSQTTTTHEWSDHQGPPNLYLP